MPPASRRPSLKQSIRARDAGLRRVSIATRVLVAGSIVGTGMFTALAAWAQPARARIGRITARSGLAGSAPSSLGGGSSSTTAPAVQSDDGGGDSNLAPPIDTPAASSPQYTYTSPPVVSGAS